MPRRFPHLRGQPLVSVCCTHSAAAAPKAPGLGAAPLRRCGALPGCRADPAGYCIPRRPAGSPGHHRGVNGAALPTPIAITPRAATVDVLATAESADSDVHSSPRRIQARMPPRRRIFCRSIRSFTPRIPTLQAGCASMAPTLTTLWFRQTTVITCAAGLTDCIPPPERCFWMSAAALPRQTPLERPMP